jgi:DNA (cytosine-5)-methyltransferase 1/tRNA (cytosine38-C5)-methyltransferase
MSLRAAEFFSGLGGWRYSLGDRAQVIRAFDISGPANATYAQNHRDSPSVRELATVPAQEIKDLRADLWLLSPPCQPFCRMGKRKDISDPRSRAFLNLLKILEEHPPQALALENVEGFLGSQAHDLLIRLLVRQGFHAQESRLCPTHFGIPNQRPRVYVLASRQPLPARQAPRVEPGPLAPYLDRIEEERLYLPASILGRHGPGLDIVRPEERRSACFIGGYGRRWVGSGSFLRTPRGVRRFSPAEIARLLGFPPDFGFPAGLSLENQYKLLGNSLSLPVARWVLQGL